MAMQYYLQFTDASGRLISLDGGSLYSVSDFSFGSSQTLNIGSLAGGTGAGKVALGGISFTLGSSNLSTLLDQMMASGVSLSHVDLYGFDPVQGQVSPTASPVVHDTFKLAAVKSDEIDPTSGAHQVTLDYGGVVESAAPQNPDGTLGTPVTKGWNAVTNTSDNSQTTDISGRSVANPTATLSQVATTAGSPGQNLDVYMQLRDSQGHLLGGGSKGWIAVSAADLSALQTLNIGLQSSGAGAGKIVFNPLSVSFRAGTLQPYLLAALASGQELEIEMASYKSSSTGQGALVDDYRFGIAGVASEATDETGLSTYTFKYGQEQVTHYTPSSDGSFVSPENEGWDSVKNMTIAGQSQPTIYNQQAPTTFSSALTVPQAAADGVGSSTRYYLQFTDASGRLISLDGGSLYSVSDFSFGSSQTLNIGSLAGGTGAGKVALGGISFTLGSSNLSTLLDQMMASGVSLSHVDLYGFDPVQGQVSPTASPVVHDTFKLAAVKSDEIDPTSGAHQVTLDYGGVVESAAPQNPDGTLGTPVTKGWNAVTNTSDNSQTTDISGRSVANPTATLSQVATTAGSPGQNLDVYMQLRDSQGHLLGGGSKGWIAVSAADLSALQTLNIGSQSSGAGAGKIVFNPLSVSFRAGTLQPYLLAALASGQELEIEMASYKSSSTGQGALVDDYRFGIAGVASEATDETGLSTYTFKYGQEQVTHYTPSSDGSFVSPENEGWDSVKNMTIAGQSQPTIYNQQAPTTFSSALTVPQAAADGVGSSTRYYLQFTDASGRLISLDGGSLYSVSDFSFGSSQTLNIGSLAGGTGAGKVALGGISFTLGSSNLSTLLDQMMASGVSLSHVDLYGFDPVQGQVSPTASPVVHDTFKLAAVKSDEIDPTSGAHQVTLDYGGVVESAAPQNPDGTLGTPVTKGWNAVTNTSDNSQTTDISGRSVANPTATLSQVATTAGSPGQNLDVYMQLRDSQGHLLGGGSKGWIEVSAADLSALQTLNIGSQSSGAGAGKIVFNPLSVSFRAGTLQPYLLAALASGQELEIEMASYKSSSTGQGALVDDYRFGIAGVASEATDETGLSTYTFKYGQEQVTHYTPSSDGSFVSPENEGWDSVKNMTIAGQSQPTIYNQQAPTTFSSALTVPQQGYSNACYCKGTLIATQTGDKPVEALAIGDVLLTACGDHRPIKWIGHRAFAGRFVNANEDILPICFKAGSLGEAVPRRDLWVSPKHAMFLDGVLIQAEHLVNGVSIVQADRVDLVEYFHVELDSHDVILAEGAWSESFIDDHSRGAFHNAHDFAALYPEDEPREPLYCAPRIEDGPLLDDLRRMLAARAGLCATRATTLGALRGAVDQIQDGAVIGWAQNLDHPDAPVCLDVLVDGILVRQTLAETFRPDLLEAGIGDGHHAFRTPLPPSTDPLLVEIRRSADGTVVGRLVVAAAA